MDDSETLVVDASVVGMVIGRQGENMRRIESSTGARVQFQDAPEAMGAAKFCKITGNRTSREAAKNEVLRIIEDSGRGGARGNAPPPDRGFQGMPGGAYEQGAPPADEASSQIMVPNRTVGLIIGRGGETIKDLQERSGCHVNIVGEQKSVNGLRPVNLVGPLPAMQVAKDLIMEIVESDSKNTSARGGPPQRDPSSAYPPFGDAGGGQEKITDTIYVPSQAVGMIIGKGTYSIPHFVINLLIPQKVARLSKKCKARQVAR